MVTPLPLILAWLVAEGPQAFGRQQGLRTKLVDAARFDLSRHDAALARLTSDQFQPLADCLALADAITATAQASAAPITTVPTAVSPPSTNGLGPAPGAKTVRLGALLANWNPSREVLSLPRAPLPPGLCRFDWARPPQRDAALALLRAEIPFVLLGLPSVRRASQRWTWRFLAEHIRGATPEPPKAPRESPWRAQRATAAAAGSGVRLTELSKGARFLFWDTKVANALPPAAQLNFSAPSAKMFINYRVWRRSARIKLEQAMKLASHRAVTHAAVTSVAGAAAAAAAAAAPTLGGGGMSERMDERQRKREEEEAEAAFRRSTFATMLLNSAQDGWIEEDLALFRSRAVTAGTTATAGAGLASTGTDVAESALMGSAREAAAPSHRGTHCRLAMPASTSAVHFDAGRNLVAMVRGHRRYVLLHPSQCRHLELQPTGHPSARHSRVSWLAAHNGGNWSTAHPELAAAAATEVVLAPGELLFIPSYYFHHITSLGVSMQCNSRAGFPEHSQATATMQQCGFGAVARDDALSHDTGGPQRHSSASGGEM